jgi:hypothetical protein
MSYFHYFAELAQIKSIPTDSELAVQIDETESKVRRVAHPLSLHDHTHLMHNPNPYTHTISFCLLRDRSQNSANTSSLCARVRRSSQQPSLTRWTPSGPNGVPNGSSEEKYSTSARSPLLYLSSRVSYGNDPTRRLTLFFLHIFMNGKFLGTRFRPVVPT